MRSEETGQPAGRTRGTKGDGHNERRRQMGGGGVRRGGNAKPKHTSCPDQAAPGWLPRR